MSKSKPTHNNFENCKRKDVSKNVLLASKLRVLMLLNAFYNTGERMNEIVRVL